MGNPLVAEAKDSTQSYSGISLLESAHDLKSAIESGDWASVALGSVGTALDALSMAMDPFGAILAAGVGWLMEHVGPLKDALNALAGNPDEITAHSETWKNIAAELGEIGQDLAAMSVNDTASWTGVAGDAYRRRAADTVALLGSAQEGAAGAASGVKTAGEVVAAVRALVRDIIAELVGHLISWALQVAFTLGVGLAWVVPEVIAAVAKTAAHIADLVNRLIKALQTLAPLLKRAGDLFGDATSAMRSIKPGGAKPIAKFDDLPAGPSAVDTPRSVPSGSPTSSGKIPHKPESPRDRAVGVDSRVCKSDPVDIATGEVVMTQVDLTIEGSPDLVLERTHISSYRAGRWFGPSWVSTVDQRLEVDDDDVCYFSADGMILVYPLNLSEAAVLPVEGPRYPLRRTADGYRLDDRSAQRTLVFAGKPGRSVVPLVAIEYDNGLRVTVEYSLAGAPSVLRRSDGFEVRFLVSGNRIVAAQVVDAVDGTVVPAVRYGYNKLGQLTQIADSGGRPMTLDYDLGNRLVGWQDRTGTWYRYVYDEAGRCVRTVGADGFFSGGFGYDTESRVTRYTDSLGYVSEFRLNEAGQLAEEIDPLGHSRRYSWDRYDRMLSRTDELGRVTGYSYEDGELRSVTRPDGSVVRYTATPEGGVSLETGEHDVVSRRDYAPGAAPDPLTDPMGVSRPYLGEDAPDPFDDGSSSVEARPAAAPGDRDLFGRTRITRTASGGAVRLGWTAEGRRSTRTGPLGRHETWEFDAEGNLVEHRGAAGQVTRRSYGAFALPVADVDPVGGRTSYAYDRELRLVGVTNPRGLTWHYTYDPAGRLIEERDFDGRLLKYSYDGAGQLLNVTNGLGESTEYRYDALGNVVERRTAAGITTYEFDALGRLARATNADSVLEILRDAHGRVVEETVNGLALRWAYDETGVHRHTPSGIDSSWRFDEAGRPAVLMTAGHVVRLRHDEAGREVERLVDGNMVLERRFDEEDQLVAQQVTAGGVAVLDRRYRYRVDGRLVGIDDSVTGSLRLKLDAAGRATEVATPLGVEKYRYDVSGNIVASAAPWSEALDGPRRYVNNALAEAGSIGYGVDRQGRMISRGTRGQAGREAWTYSWDPLDRMTGLTTPDGARWRYLYDPLGRRFAKQRWETVAGALTMTDEVRFVWSGFDLVEQIARTGDGSRRVLTWERHPTGGQPMTQVEADERQSAERFRSIVTDTIGTPIALLDGDGDIAWHAETSFWGKTLAPAGTGTPLGFPGQYRDDESGLHYNVYRYYDPEIARYVSQDPLGLRPGPNPAAYVTSPHLAADPLGLAACGAPGSAKSLPNRPGGGSDAGNVDAGSKTPDGAPNADPDVINLSQLSWSEYAQWSAKFDKLMKTDPDGAWFWSGGVVDGDGKYHSVMDMANFKAHEGSGTTLEDKLDSSHLQMPGWNNTGPTGNPELNDPLSVPLWTDASAGFAHNASGDVHVVLGPNRRPDNVFDMTEFPILRHNPKVTRIFTVDSVTGAEDLLWSAG